MATKFYGYKTIPADAKPIAKLRYTEITALLGSIIQLDARASYDPEGNLLTYKWVFNQVPLGSGITNANFNDLRSDRSAVAFTPDKTGVFVVQLIVNDGAFDSNPVTATIDIQLSKVPCGEGIIPDARFIWSYISDFWNLVEDREYITSIWSAAIQLIGAEVITLWSNDYNKSLKTIQNTVQRRWQKVSMVTDLLDERQTVLAVNKRTGRSDGNNGTSGNIGETPGVGYTTVFHAPYGDPDGGYADFERMKTHFGAKGRLLVVNGSGYTIDRTHQKIDPSTAEECSIIIVDEEAIPEGLVGAVWRIPHVLHTPGVNLEEVGARRGDIVVFEVRRKDIGLAAELRAQVVGVDRTRLGFEFTLEDLETGGRTTDRELFRQVVQDLKIIPYDADDNTITAAAKALLSFIPVGTNLATRPFSPFRIIFTAKKIIHNSVSENSVDIISIPALQESLYEPPLVLLENLDYTVDTGTVSFVSGLFSLKEPAPAVLWAECAFIDNSEAIESNFGRMVNLLREDFTISQTRVPYLSAVKGLYYAYTNGPSVANIRLGLQILLGLPFAEERGQILELESSYTTDSEGNDLGRLLVEDVDKHGRSTGFRRLYFYPAVVGVEVNPITNIEYVVGDVVEQWAPLSKGVEVQDYIKVPDFWRRTLGGMEILKYFTFKIAVDGNVFDANDVNFAFEFVKAIKPAYTKVIATAFRLIEDDIEVEEAFASRMTTQFYDNIGWGIEATVRSDDFNQQGFTLWNYGSRPFSTRTLQVPRDVKTVKSGSYVHAQSVTGWDLDHIRGRIVADDPYANASVVEGDIFIIFRGQAGAGLLFDGMYEIDTVIDENNIRLLQEVTKVDPDTFEVEEIDADLFDYGSGLVCCVVRRASNPMLKGDDLVTDGTNLVTSATANFLLNEVGIDDHLIIEDDTHGNQGECRIEALNPHTSGTPLDPSDMPNISETQVALKNLDGTIPTLTVGTEQTFRVIRPIMMSNVIPGAKVINTSGTTAEIEVLDTGVTPNKPKDVFTPGLVGTTVNIANSENPANDGDFTVSGYIHSGRIEISSTVSVTDTLYQAVARLSSIWHPGFEKVEELSPNEAFEAELTGV